MKKIYSNLNLKVILALQILLCGSSCSDYLDTEPYSFVTVENFYESEEDIELALTGCYSALNSAEIQGVWRATFNANMNYMLSAGTDELVTRRGITDPVFAPFGLAGVNSQNETIRGNFFFLFAGVNRTNFLLDGLEAIEMADDRKLEIRAEAHFLRGLYYMYLAKMYGGVPIYTTPDHDPQAKRESLEKVYSLIIDDFRFAYENLPNRANKVGRANKWSAAGFLAKVYTYLGSAKVNNVGNELNFALNSFDWVDVDQMYINAREITSEIIGESGFELTERYDYLFRESTDQWKREESLFSSVGSENPSMGNNHVWLFWMIPTGNPNVTGGGYGWFRPTGELYYKYVASDIRRNHNLTLDLHTQQSSIENIEGVNYYVPRTLDTPLNGGYTVGKYRYMDPAEKNIDIVQSIGDYPILRYADILLLHAEALFFTGNESEAREYLTMVRERATSEGIGVNALNEAYYKDDFIAELLDERSRELCFESWRRIDLIRFGRFESSINSLSDDTGSYNDVVPLLKSNWDAHKIWFPIPQTEIELSPMEQNPGY